MVVLSVQINVKNVAALDGTTELTSSTPLESKAVTGDGIVALTLGPGQPFGVFDPGLFVGGQQTDYFLQSLQVSSTAGTAGGTVRLVGTAPPSALVQPRFPFLDLSTTELHTFFDVKKIIPTGFKLAFQTIGTGPHVIRLTLWPIRTTEQAVEVRDTVVTTGGGGGGPPTGPAGGMLAGTYPNPDVRGIRETSGPTSLFAAAIADGQFLRRSGATLIGAIPVAALPTSYIAALGLRRVDNSHVEIATGACRDDADTFDIRVTSLISVNIAVLGANGRDAGAEAANTWYSVWVIADSGGVNPVAGLLSTSSTSPTLPSGYNKKRRLGWTRNNGSSNFMLWQQVQRAGNARKYLYDAEAAANVEVLTAGSATVYTMVNCANFVPPTSSFAEMIVRHLAENTLKWTAWTANGVTETTPPMRIFSGADALDENDISVAFQLRTDTLQRVQYRNNAGGGSTTAWVYGFVDEV